MKTARVITLVAVALLTGQATAMLGSLDNLPSPEKPAPVKIKRVEIDDKWQPKKETEVDDELIWEGEGVAAGNNTRGLSRLGLPPVGIHCNIGNATDFYDGDADTKDGGRVNWHWTEMQGVPPVTYSFKGALITWTAADGSIRKRWVITVVPPPASQPSTREDR